MPTGPELIACGSTVVDFAFATVGGVDWVFVLKAPTGRGNREVDLIRLTEVGADPGGLFYAVRPRLVPLLRERFGAPAVTVADLVWVSDSRQVQSSPMTLAGDDIDFGAVVDEAFTALDLDSAQIDIVFVDFLAGSSGPTQVGLFIRADGVAIQLDESPDAQPGTAVEIGSDARGPALSVDYEGLLAELGPSGETDGIFTLARDLTPAPPAPIGVIAPNRVVWRGGEVAELAVAGVDLWNVETPTSWGDARFPRTGTWGDITVTENSVFVAGVLVGARGAGTVRVVSWPTGRRLLRPTLGPLDLPLAAASGAVTGPGAQWQPALVISGQIGEVTRLGPGIRVRIPAVGRVGRGVREVYIAAERAWPLTVLAVEPVRSPLGRQTYRTRDDPPPES